MKVYISGKIAAKPRYMEEFEAAEVELSKMGHRSINPASAFQGVAWLRNGVMPLCLRLLDNADAIYMLKGWQDSKGATLEKAYAEYMGKKVFYQDEEVKMSREEAMAVLRRVQGCEENDCKESSCPGCKYEYSREEYRTALKVVFAALEEKLDSGEQKGVQNGD